jgi:hypothetical protein
LRRHDGLLDLVPRLLGRFASSEGRNISASLTTCTLIVVLAVLVLFPPPALLRGLVSIGLRGEGAVELLMLRVDQGDEDEEALGGVAGERVALPISDIASSSLASAAASAGQSELAEVAGPADQPGLTDAAYSGEEEPAAGGASPAEPHVSPADGDGRSGGSSDHADAGLLGDDTGDASRPDVESTAEPETVEGDETENPETGGESLQNTDAELPTPAAIPADPNESPAGTESEAVETTEQPQSGTSEELASSAPAVDEQNGEGSAVELGASLPVDDGAADQAPPASQTPDSDDTSVEEIACDGSQTGANGNGNANGQNGCQGQGNGGVNNGQGGGRGGGGSGLDETDVAIDGPASGGDGTTGQGSGDPGMDPADGNGPGERGNGGGRDPDGETGGQDPVDPAAGGNGNGRTRNGRRRGPRISSS